MIQEDWENLYLASILFHEDGLKTACMVQMKLSIRGYLFIYNFPSLVDLFCSECSFFNNFIQNAIHDPSY